jgi:hypothetical protein
MYKKYSEPLHVTHEQEVYRTAITRRLPGEGTCVIIWDLRPSYRRMAGDS